MAQHKYLLNDCRTELERVRSELEFVNRKKTEHEREMVCSSPLTTLSIPNVFRIPFTLPLTFMFLVNLYK